ncbi:BRCA1 C Terminus domain-containing protein [Diplocarpon rosae]|nr:BRCA1 C Terminus domain-containing protein [Diplocarpon rosae]
MPPSKSTIPAAAQPKFAAQFDAWNSSSTGHQRAENALGHSIGWRQSRNVKLSYQFKSGGTGGQHISDKVGAGSKDWDGKAKALIPKEVRERARVSVADMITRKEPVTLSNEDQLTAQRKREDDFKDEERLCRKKGIFDGLVIYVNGSTYPLISDHKLKHVLAENGGKMSLHLGRRQVTHVILGKPSGTLGMGAGGGLSGTKLEREIRRVGGCGVKYIGVEWVLESLKSGKRLSETQFTNLKVAPKNQQSVYGIFKKSNSTASRVPKS